MTGPIDNLSDRSNLLHDDSQGQWRLKFWSDSFDMDLLNLWPDLTTMLGPTADIPLWTVGSARHGRLNHATVWHPHGAYLWLEKQDLTRDEDGWFSINGCVSNAQEIECNWLEWLRSWWAHHHGFLLSGEYFDACGYEDFERIMYSIRGWRGYDPDDVQCACWMSLMQIVDLNRRFARHVEIHRLGREDCPYFATAIPGSPIGLKAVVPLLAHDVNE